MKKMTSLMWGMGAVAVISLIAATAEAATVAQWTFETSQPAGAGPFSPEVGSGSASGSHAGAAVYSTPAGDGSSHSFSANTWAVGDYWQFEVSTVGLSGEILNWDQTSSTTGPQQFILQYSTDGTTFTPFGSTLLVASNAAPNAVWNSTTSSAIYHFSVDLSSVTALDNQTTDFFRIVDGSTISEGGNGGVVAAGGTDRVDNFTVTAAAVPEPSAVALVGAGLIALLAVRPRRS